LPAAAIGWACALTAAVLPERHAYPPLFSALGGLLTAICHAPSARGWTIGLVSYEALMLRELGYGGNAPPALVDWEETLATFDHMRGLLQRYLLADRRADVMAARDRLRATLARI
jgi:DNA repair protein RecO (recombination protein O)